VQVAGAHRDAGAVAVQTLVAERGL